MDGQRDLPDRARALIPTTPDEATGSGPGSVPTPEQAVIAELIAAADRVAFDERLDRALDMAEDEETVVDIAARAVHTVLPDNSTEVLLVGPKGVNLLQVAEAGPDEEGPGCPVIGPSGCPALRQSEPLRFDSSEALDACPHLRDRIRGECSATCIPLKILDRPNAVIHTVGGPEAALSDPQVGYIRSIARKTANRITLLRALQHTELVPSYDSLTGLLDPGSTEAKMAEMTKNLIPYSIALCELDDFISYHENYGSDVADRALRQFASSLRDVVRPSDVVGRYTGDEFLVVFPDTATADAANALERVRESLALNLAAAEVPAFTASFGVADSTASETMDDLFIASSVALSVAKESGQNRVVVSGDEPYDDAVTDVTDGEDN